MELELTGGVAELQATHDRAAPSAARRRSLVCPYKGLAAFDAADSEYYCGRERLVARARGAPGRHVAVGPRRPIGQRQVLALARWSAGRVGRRHPAGQRALATDPDPAGRTSAAPRWPTSTSAVESCWPSTSSRRRSPLAPTSPSAWRSLPNWCAWPHATGSAARRARAPCRPLRALRRLPGARATAGRQSRAGPPDASGRAAPGDRVAGRACGPAMSRKGSPKELRRGRRAASRVRFRSCRPPCSTSGSVATAGG